MAGGSLSRLSRIDLSAIDPRLRDRMIHVACDVTNPLVGERGASRIFGPQKGATEADDPSSWIVIWRIMPDVIKTSLQVDVKSIPGAGAAGAWCGADGLSQCGAAQRD
ncbi:glycerate kinase I [Klebsiella pneumoniae]|uniref:Glycerate kinase I n=1 Tax=Klebsiella pneumoniae TaxID=573 RepID=A0A3S4HT06_KLEPN|nr:glycerate kinase I [Klebsiella pneumoniae]